MSNTAQSAVAQTRPTLETAVRVGRRSQLTRQRMRAAWLLLTPMLLVLAAVAGWPLMRTIYFSFTNASLADLDARHWVGFANYFSVLQMPSGRVIYDGLLVDPIWWRAVWNTVRFTVISVTCETILGMIVALVLNAEFRGRGFVRAAILIPWAIPTIVSAKMWQWMLNDQFGIINDILLRLGLISTKIAWTASADTAMVAVLVVDIWKTTPFMALLILAGMQMVPSEIYEVAKLDGVSPWKVFWRVTLPLIRPALMVAVIFRGLDAHAHLRPDLRAHAEQRADQVDVGIRPREPVRVRQVRLRLRRLDHAVRHPRFADHPLSVARPGKSGWRPLIMWIVKRTAFYLLVVVIVVDRRVPLLLRHHHQPEIGNGAVRDRLLADDIFAQQLHDRLHRGDVPPQPRQLAVHLDGRSC